jgi:Uma2 family endonuclease
MMNAMSTATVQPPANADTSLASADFGADVARVKAVPGLKLTPEEFEVADHDNRLVELVEGVVIEKEMSALAHFLSNEFADLLREALHRPHRVMVEAEFQLPGRRGTVRRPDVAVLKPETVAGYQWRDPFIRLVPDVAVEVVSPGDALYKVHAKVREFHGYGIPLVWVVIPNTREFQVHPTGNVPYFIPENGTLTAEEVLPTLRLDIAKLYKALPPTDELSAGQD